jgi:hypothetical protein
LRKSKTIVPYDSKDNQQQDWKPTGFLGIKYLPEEECLEVWMRKPQYVYAQLMKCPK